MPTSSSRRRPTPLRAAVRRWTLRLAGAAGLLGALAALGWVNAPLGMAVREADAAVPVVREVTGLHPVTMARIATPTTTEQVAEALRTSTGPVSIGGGRYSMGGQTATPGGLQLDLRQLRGVLAVDTVADTMRVLAGTTWREVQAALDPLGRAVRVMQTYNNFTVGGALSVNAHGRYIGLGPISLTVRSLRLVLADGTVADVSRTVQPERYAAALGGYGAVGVIAEATLDIARNDRIRRSWERMPLAAYPGWFAASIAGTQASDTAVVFHNGDLAPPTYDEVGALTYRRTDLPLTDTVRLRPVDQQSWVRRQFFAGLASDTWRPFTVWARRTVVDPILWRGHPVSWRNLEASYDVSELEPASRDRTTFVLQEYFVPRDSLFGAVRAIGGVLRRHAVKAVNISIRHAYTDSLPYLTWAPAETFALVLYYAQGTQPEDRRAVGVWTREAIDTVLAHGGRYYLPYQPHATRAQFRAAYPRVDSLLALKARLDPAGRFTNVLWDLYAQVPGTDTQPRVTAARHPAVLPAEVRLALDTVPGYDRRALAGIVAHPEWDLVWSSDALRDWLAAGGAPSGFAWMQATGTFWRSYRATWKEADRVGRVPDGFHPMLLVIGMSTSIEYALTGLWEHTIGWLAEAVGGHATAADRLAAKQAAAYSDLIHTAGWYRFDFLPYVPRLWSTPLGSGGQIVRSLERRLFLTLLWSVKAGYAQLLTWGMGAEADVRRRDVVVYGRDTTRTLTADATVHALGWRGYERLAVPRYRPFEGLLQRLAEDPLVRIAEINGSPTVALTLRAPAGATLPAGLRVLTQYQAVADAPGGAARQRVLGTVDAEHLLEVLRAVAARSDLTLDHVYDF